MSLSLFRLALTKAMKYDYSQRVGQNEMGLLPLRANLFSGNWLTRVGGGRVTGDGKRKENEREREREIRNS